MSRQSKAAKLNILVFGLLWLFYNFAMFVLIHRQSVCYGGRYTSDILPYIAYMQGLEVKYDFPYPVMFLLGKFFSLFTTPEWGMTLSVTALNSLTPLMLKYYMDDFFRQKGRPAYLFSTLCTFALLTVSMLFLDLSAASIGWRYRGVFSPNPLHNATYLATRPFTVICFFMAVRLLGEYETLPFESPGKAAREYGVFAFFLLLTTLTKPSFTFGFVTTMALVLFVRTCLKKFRNFKATLLFSCCALPTFAALLYQFRGVFTGTNIYGEENGIGIGFLTAWSTTGKSIPAALFLGLFFPLVVFCCFFKQIRTDEEYRLSLEMLLVNLFMLVFLYEKGYRCAHINFAWGYMHGLFFSYLASLRLLLTATLQVLPAARTPECRKKLPFILLCWLAFLWHLVCGIVYLIPVFAGEIYL